MEVVNREKFLRARDSLKANADKEIAESKQRYDSLTNLYKAREKAAIIHSEKLDTMKHSNLVREVHNQYNLTEPEVVAPATDEVSDEELRFLLKQNDVANLAPVQESRIHELFKANEEFSDMIILLKADSADLRAIANASQALSVMCKETLDKEREANAKEVRKLRRQQKLIAIVAGVVIVAEATLLLVHGD